MSAGKMSDGSPVTPELDARMLADLREWRARVTGNEPISVALILDELDMLLRIAAERDALKREACAMPDEQPLNATPVGREAKISGEFVTMRVDEWRRVTDELSRLRTDEATRLDAADERMTRGGAGFAMAAAALLAPAFTGGVNAAAEPAMRTPATCSRCGGRIYYSRTSHAWVHAGAVPEGCVPRPKPTRVEIPAGHALIQGEIVPLPGAEKIGPRCYYCGGRVLLFAEGWLHDASEPSRGEHPALPDLLPFCDCGSVDKNGDDLGEHGPRCPYHLAVLRTSPTISARTLDDLCRRTLAAQARLA